MKNENKPTFPLSRPIDETMPNIGLTKREYFAGLAMQGLLAEGYLRHQDDNCVLISKTAVNYADELLKQLETK